MEHLLFLAHRIPYPPNKGDKIRSWHMLRHLAERYKIHLGCFIDDPDDWQHRGTLEQVCESTRFERLQPMPAKIASLTGLLTGDPLTLGYYRSPALQRWVDDVTRRFDIRHVLVFSSSMAQFLTPRLSEARVVVDFVDIDSDKWRQYARAKPWPASWIYSREARTLAAFENRMAAEVHASLFVSEAEAEMFRRQAPQSASRVFALNNGVDFDFFDPAQSYDNPFGGAGPVLVFTGQMDYWANVDAVVWFANEVLPKVRARASAAQFWIVGANPSPEVAKLADLEGITVTGRVPDVRPFIAHADAVVAPLRLARGVQNKVLEAMSMAKAVIATPQAADGLHEEPRGELLVAEDPETFAVAVLDLLGRDDRTAIGERSRQKVIESYGWAANLRCLNTILEGSAV